MIKQKLKTTLHVQYEYWLTRTNFTNPTNMPKATSQVFKPADVRPGSKRKGESSAAGAASGSGAASSGGRNHLFNTERFGQHILTNPLVAQG